MRGREEARRTEGDSEMTEDTSGRELGSEDGVADGEEEGGGRRSGFVYGAGAKCPKLWEEGRGSVGAQPRRSKGVQRQPFQGCRPIQ